MAITFHPKLGMVLVCDFSGFRPPEIVKKRPVVVVGEEQEGREDTCLVVPLSTVVPVPRAAFHHDMSPASLPSRLRAQVSWAKCDMVTTVACSRLDRYMNGQDALGKRLYVAHYVTRADRAAILRGVLAALHLSSLAAYVLDE